ncbi:MAG: hypothetical protein R3Y22_09920 [Bacteroidales bacterium]
MEYSDILIYIIVISVVFISTLAKKRGTDPNPIDKKPTQTNNSTNERPKHEKSLADKYNWTDNYNKTTKIPEVNNSDPTPEPTSNSSLPLNSAEKLRQAIIVSEILKRKF